MPAPDPPGPSTSLARTRSGGLRLARGPAGTPSPREWVDALPLRGGVLVLGGAALAAAGLAGASFGATGLLAVMLCGGLITLGGGLAFLGADKTRRARALPATSRLSSVAAERGRRVRSVMAAAEGQWTYEELRGRLGWTEDAVLEGLLHLRDSGQIMEDLDLETGKWVYRLQESETTLTGSSVTLSLDDRVRRLGDGDPP